MAAQLEEEEEDGFEYSSDHHVLKFEKAIYSLNFSISAFWTVSLCTEEII
jgi:hypothetical protein